MPVAHCEQKRVSGTSTRVGPERNKVFDAMGLEPDGALEKRRGLVLRQFRKGDRTDGRLADIGADKIRDTQGPCDAGRGIHLAVADRHSIPRGRHGSAAGQRCCRCGLRKGGGRDHLRAAIGDFGMPRKKPASAFIRPERK